MNRRQYIIEKFAAACREVTAEDLDDIAAAMQCGELKADEILAKINLDLARAVRKHLDDQPAWTQVHEQ